MVGKIELIFAELMMASEILRFENISVCQMIYAIICNYPFIDIMFES